MHVKGFNLCFWICLTFLQIRSEFHFNGYYTGTSNICVMVTTSAIKLEVPISPEISTLIHVPKNAVSTADCDRNDTEVLTVTWDNENYLKFFFLQNDSRYVIQTITLTLLLNGTITTFYHGKPEFSVFTRRSYYCGIDHQLDLTHKKSSGLVAKIYLNSLQYQAFMNTTISQYAPAWDCETHNPYMMPMVWIGCVVIVQLLLYWIVCVVGNKCKQGYSCRRQRDGYTLMS